MHQRIAVVQCLIYVTIIVFT